jgi:hypothetical protein
MKVAPTFCLLWRQFEQLKVILVLFFRTKPEKLSICGRLSKFIILPGRLHQRKNATCSTDMFICTDKSQPLGLGQHVVDARTSGKIDNVLGVL